jgi:hypothetical protein
MQGNTIMASLFVAFVYLLVENKSRVQRKMIPQGQQLELRGLSLDDIAATIDHHRIYGARTEAEAKRQHQFIGVIYSDEGVIPIDGQAGVIVQNVEALKETGKELRREAAVVADQSLLNSAPEGSTLTATNVEVVEVVQKDQPDRDQEIHEQRKITPEKNDQRQDRRGKQRLGRA